MHVLKLNKCNEKFLLKIANSTLGYLVVQPGHWAINFSVFIFVHFFYTTRSYVGPGRRGRGP